jgi:hypothetical protein
MPRPIKAAWLALLLPALAAAGCFSVWDPEVAALVNGRPITLAEVDQVLAWGLYPQLGPDPGLPAAARALVLEKLIDERVILAEAALRGVSVSDEKVEEAFTILDSAWFGRPPPAAAAAGLRKALRNQLLLRKMEQRIALEERILSAEEWRAFWRDWPKSRPLRFRVRALLIPAAAKPPGLPDLARGDLDQLAQRFKLDGLPVVISEPVWLQGDRLAPGLFEALETASVRGRLSDPFRLQESQAVYEVLAVDRGPSAQEEWRAAQAAFEARAGEKAFSRWLAARRAAADIRINPDLAVVNR